MTDPTPLFGRCGLDLEHERHARADGAICDGQVPATPTGDAPTTLAGLLGVTDAPRAWALPSLTDQLLDELGQQLVAFVDFLNTDCAVQVPELVLSCWPAHRRLVLHLVVLYSGWVDGHQGLGATAERAMYWHDRWLPNFYKQLPAYFGKAPDACTPGVHRADWNPAAAQLQEARTTMLGADPRAALAQLHTNPAHLET